jgi:nitroreductase
MESTNPNSLLCLSESSDRPATCGVDVLAAIHDRRAVRSYTGMPVGAARIRALLDSAVRAPSAVNAQPWAFVVVQDPLLLARISARSKAKALASMRPGTPQWARREMLLDPDFDVLYGAGTLIVIVASPGEWHVNEDCCLAGQNLMLAAHGMGLGTCPIGFARAALEDPDLRAELSIPADHAVVLPIIVGHPRELPPMPPRRAPRVLAWK